MLISSAILELEELARKADYRVEYLSSMKAQPTREEYHALSSLSLRFSELAVKFSEQIDHIKGRHAESAVLESENLLARAGSARKDLIADGQPKSLVTFRRNFTLIFGGPKESALDSSSAKSRNKLTRARCERIRCLDPESIVTWAAAFPPTTWTAGSMKDHVFDHLVEEIGPGQAQVWPKRIREMLHTIAAEEPLQGSSRYGEFIQGQLHSDIEK
jgi:hypothetical protein